MDVILCTRHALQEIVGPSTTVHTKTEIILSLRLCYGVLVIVILSVISLVVMDSGLLI